MKRYYIAGLADTCPLCIEGDGRKTPNRPIFQIEGENGGFSGPCCANHVAAILKMEGAQVDKKPEPPRPDKPVNGPPPALPVK